MSNKLTKKQRLLVQKEEKMRKILRKIYVRLLCLIGRAIDISSKSKFPAGDLSNFTSIHFLISWNRLCLYGGTAARLEI